MKNILRFFILLFFLQYSQLTYATHNRAGEIVVKEINGCGSGWVEATIITYTKTSSTQADRDTLTICWGDDICEQVVRSNGNGDPQANDVKVNKYVAIHKYAGPGHFTVSMTDPNRNGGVLNVNFPGSENVQFHIQTTISIFNQQFTGCNNSPELENPPFAYACVGEIFIHNPAAHDPDGDNLTYELIVPMQDVNTPVPNYLFPDAVTGNGCCFTFNTVNGDMIWNAPQRAGEYNVAFRIISWRDGIAIDTMIRDMQILVQDCDNNHAPQIETVDEICVIAGEEIEFDVKATDPDAGDKIKLTATGAAFDLEVSPADDKEGWSTDATYQNQPVQKAFRWLTTCEHISNLAYTVVFQAEDDFFLQSLPNSGGLSTSKTVRIKVVGPPPTDLQAKPSSERIDISWLKPYACEAAQDDYFFGFSVWRREGSNNFTPDCKQPGLDGKGYTRIKALATDVVNGRYQFSDTDVERGRTYCYRILGRFAKRSGTGQPYNFVESLASQEICVQLSRDVPLITNVSVEQTATNNGRIRVAWTKPVATDLDTLLNPPPYRYELLRSRDFTPNSPVLVTSFTAPTFWQLNQVEYFDQVTEVNTKNNANNYQIAFYVNNETQPLGLAAAASSVFLEITPTDNTNILSWKFNVPWVNDKYNVYRKNSSGWQLIATAVADTFYTDTGLLNGREYCYYVESFGSYGILGVPAPLINLSQEACGVPVDNVPPCPPELAVFNICNERKRCQDIDVLDNRLEWVNPMNLCATTDDVVSYKIYYAAIEGQPLTLFASVSESGDTTFLHEPERGLAGCYAVTALDTFSNESAFSNLVCVDNCPNYSLPNAFTPNNDNANDLYQPFPYCFIESIELNVFNRWGELVYKTKDPNINWTGENLNGKTLPSGTYYYKCKVYEQRVAGTVEADGILNGYIDLIR